MKIFSGKKHKKGFTITEVMMTVAILVIIMGIVVPGIVGIYKKLKIAKLDDIAREIYTSAQSRTISLSVSGQLAYVNSTSVDEPITPVSSEPDDGGEVADDTDNTYKYVYRSGAEDESTDGPDMILPFGSIEEEVRQNYYIIEYDQITGMVNKVYYWEDENSNVMNGYIDGSIPSDRDKRMDYKGGMVGYYEGDAVERDTGDSAVTAELVNDEELYLKITQGYESGKLLKGTVTVTLTDLDTNVSRTASFKNESSVGDEKFGGSADGSGSSGRLGYLKYYHKGETTGGEAPLDADAHYRLILDSLKSGLRFSEVCPEEDGSFLPGCNLKVTVSFQENGKQVQEESFLTNSLFASVEEEKDPASGDSSRTAYISCGRHLENLGSRWVYPEGTSGISVEQRSVTLSDAEKAVKAVEKAVQTEDIDWHDSLKAIGGDPVSFMPIENENLKEFDGGGNKISRMDIYDYENEEAGGSKEVTVSRDVGLFSQFEGDKLQNINLVNCTVKNLTSESGRHVGLLAGTINKCEVIDCHAYAENNSTVNEETADSGETGSDTPVGKAADSGNEFSCFIDVPSNTESAGGLFGSVQEAAVEKCSASLTRISGNAKYAGGLAGSVVSGSSVSISECYADTGLWSDGDNEWSSGSGLAGICVGGLVGNIEGTSGFTMANSYAVGWVPNSGTTACGLVGNSSTSSATIQNCYAALLKKSSEPGEKDVIVNDLVPEELGKAKEIDTCINYNGGYGDFDYLAEQPYVQGEEKRVEATHAYGMPNTDTDAAYPFPRLSGLPHYGDWPQESNEVHLRYYEVYKNKKDDKYSIGFYNVSGKGLKDSEDYAVVMDGYALMFPVGESGRYDGINMNDAEEVEKNLPVTVEYEVKEVHSAATKLMNAENKFDEKVYKGLEFDDNKNKIVIEEPKQDTGSSEEGTNSYYYPLFLSSVVMTEDQEAVESAEKNSYYQKLEVKKTGKTDPIISGYFNPYVAKSTFVAEKSGKKLKTPRVSIFRTSRQITAYVSSDVMQKTAVGSEKVSHILRLERDIALNDNIITDSSVTGDSGKECKDLSIKEANANVILRLNGKTLKGTAGGSVVSFDSRNGKLTVYGGTAKGTITGGKGTKTGTGSNAKTKGGGIYVKDGTFNMTGGTISGNEADEGGGIYIGSGVTGKLKNVTIKGNTSGDNTSVSSHNANGITLDGCTITD